MIELFTPFKPMEPVSRSSPFDDENYGFQIKWDGTRILAHISQGQIQLFNRKKHKRTKQYPEIVIFLANIFKSRDVILDGEIIALTNGKPNFQQLMRRDWATDPSTIKHLMSKIPVTYVIFDIIYLDGEPLIYKPFFERDSMLHNIIKSQDPVVLTDTFKERGTLLFELIRQKELEGIVAKRLDSRYQIGKKNDSWIKIKNKRQLTAMIGGFLYEGQEVRSFLLGIHEQQEFIFIGRASSGLKAKEAKEMYKMLQNYITDICPFSNAVPLIKRENVFWVKPRFTIEVEYMDFTEEGFLRHPVIKSIHL